MKKFIFLYTILPAVVGIAIGFSLVKLRQYTMPYSRSTVSIVSQDFVPADTKYADISGVETYKYNGRHITNILLDDGESSSTEGPNISKTVKNNSRVADNELMARMFGNFNASKYNHSKDKFQAGTRIETRYCPSHYVIKYKSNWNSKETRTFKSLKPVNSHKVNMDKFNKFMLDNHYFPEYYTN